MTQLEQLMQEEASHIEPLCHEGQIQFDALPEGAPVIRHGDLIVKKAPLPEGAARLDERAILRSDATGHIHGVKGQVAIYQAEGDDRHYLVVDGPAVIGRHLEHHDAALPEGTMVVERKREGRAEYTRFVMD